MDMSIVPGDIVNATVALGLTHELDPAVPTKPGIVSTVTSASGVMRSRDHALVLAIVPVGWADDRRMLLLTMETLQMGWAWERHLHRIDLDEDALTEEERCKDPLLRDRVVA